MLAIPKELEFILADDSRAPNNILSAYWLLSDFDAREWECQFDRDTLRLDFNVQLENGSRLTDSANGLLLNLLKRFILLQGSELAGDSKPRKARTDHTNVLRAVHIVDYLLVRTERLRLGAVGLAGFDEDEAHRFTATLCGGKNISDALYDVANVISDYLRKVLKAEEENKLSQVFLSPVSRLEKHGIEDLEVLPEETSLPTFSLDEINRVRRIFFRAGWYRRLTSHSHIGFVFERRFLIGAAFDRRVIAEKKRAEHFDLSIFSWSAPTGYVTEYSRAPVVTADNDDRASDEYVDNYLRTFTSATYFLAIGEPLFCEEALSAVRHIRDTEGDRLKTKGRFAIVPFEIADLILGQSLDVIYRSGEAIVSAVLGCCKSGVPNEATRIRGARVESWDLKRGSPSGESAASLRTALGAFEALKIFVGCTVACISSMAANRMEEMETLPSDCIYTGDDGRWFLRLRAGKKNVQEQHQLRDKPIPPLVADAIQLLQRMQKELAELGYEVGDRLFQLPHRKSEIRLMRDMSRGDLCECLDMLCDFVETPLDEAGRRYYVRPHQLRRVTGYLFFWAGFKGGIEIVGKFLGHGSFAETQRYCTEAIKGRALRHVKAGAAARAVHEGLAPAQALRAWLAERHDVDLHTLSVMAVDTIADWIDEALASNNLDIRVERLATGAGEDFRTVVVIKEPT